MTIEELKKYKWFVATCKYEGIVGKKHCFTYDVDNLNTNLLSGMILVDDELVKELDKALQSHYPRDPDRVRMYLQNAIDRLDVIEKECGGEVDNQGAEDESS